MKLVDNLNKFLHKDTSRFAVGITLFSLTGLVASFWQTAVKIGQLKNPDEALSCSINPVVDCGSVLNNNLSAVFGVPNSMIGIAAFSLLLMAGLALLAGVKPTRGFKRLVLVLSLIMLSFSAWFFAVSLYSIGKICIFCVFIWLSTVPMAIMTFGHYGDSIFSNKGVLGWKIRWFKKSPWEPVILVYVLGLLLFLLEFRDYYF